MEALIQVVVFGLYAFIGIALFFAAMYGVVFIVCSLLMAKIGISAFRETKRIEIRRPPFSFPRFHVGHKPEPTSDMEDSK